MILKSILSRIEAHHKNKKWRNLPYIVGQIEEFSEENYVNLKTVREAEHQIGRYLRMRNLVNQIKEEKIEGDVLEFGTWQGLGLIYLSKLFNDKTRRYIGVDSFEGLPHSSTIWKKGQFSNTNIQLAKNNIVRYGNVESANLHLIQGWFDEPIVKKQIFNLSTNIAVVHFDADLGSSTHQALMIAEHYLKLRTQPMYFLFDDWGCHPDEVPDAFHNWQAHFQTTHQVNSQKLSSTALTRYYKLSPKCA